jgi:rubrerythrin
MTKKPQIDKDIFHKCPNCSFTVSDDQYKYARFDYPCPICKVKTLSSFETVKLK